MSTGFAIFLLIFSIYVLAVSLIIYRSVTTPDEESSEDKEEPLGDDIKVMTAAHLRLAQLLSELHGKMSPYRARRVFNEMKGLVKQVGFPPDGEAEIMNALQMHSLRSGAICKGRKKNHSRRKRAR